MAKQSEPPKSSRRAFGRKATYVAPALLLFAMLVALMPVSAGAVDKIYWSAEGSGTVQFANLNGTGSVSTLFGGEGPCGVAIDPAAGKIYWANFFSDGVRVASLDGTGTAQTLFGGEGALCGVAIDPTAGKIYWANFSSNAIRVGNLSGSGVASNLYQEPAGSAPSGVAIDPDANKIYWTNQFADQVRVGSLDGLVAASTLFDGAEAGDNPIGVAIDSAAGRIYWAALGSGQIKVGNLGGLNPAATLYSGESSPGGVALDPGQNKIYWANFDTGAIRVGNLGGSGTPDTLFNSGEASLFPALLRAPVAGSQSPAISGGANLGDALSCSTGSWQPDLLGAFLFRAPSIFEYQWRLGLNEIPGATAAAFTFTESGDYTCRVTASNEAGSASQTSATFRVTILRVKKFYDVNANGLFDPGEPTIASWKVRVGSSSYVTPKSLKVDPGSYLVSEVDPVQTNWRHTNPGSVQALAVAGQETTVQFGNVCLGGGGGLDVGFWKNKNGQALFGAGDLALMVSLNLRDEAGLDFNPTSYSTFSSWLGKPSATNMANSLSAQLAAMELNVFHGKVSGNSLIYAPGTTSANPAGFATVNAVMSEANAELGLHGLVKGGNPFRAYQTAVRDALSNANGNSTFVQATPCAFSFN